MRFVKEITAEEENFRTESMGIKVPGPVREGAEGYGSQVREMIDAPMCMIKRDFVKPEEEGTIILMAFAVVDYEKDCDGSALAKLKHIGWDGDPSGLTIDGVGLYHGHDIVISREELEEIGTRVWKEELWQKEMGQALHTRRGDVWAPKDGKGKMITIENNQDGHLTFYFVNGDTCYDMWYVDLAHDYDWVVNERGDN